MTSWRGFTEQAPELAAKIHRRFTAGETHVLATLRRDGSPRVSGTELDFHGAQIYAGSMPGAVKARDLRRDGRFAIHACPGVADGGDAKLSGTAVELTDPAEIAEVQGNTEPCHLFRLDVTDAVLTWVEGNTMLVEHWQEGGEHVRFARPGTGPVERTVLVNAG
ncbi:pyridoxamine 5'-phosphate oxidase family protein [Amycolatopsis sp. NPDC059027]|uniref:pyridoxamine 5'-phosphate oxidase family protein n=1 Tax=Amycolatopsis sp. NPDC059027 TaxID=3346709 RepID=UPI00366B447A